MSSGIRRRKTNIQKDIQNEENIKDTEIKRDGNDIIDEKLSLKGSYWLTRVVFLRSIAFIYCKYV